MDLKGENQSWVLKSYLFWEPVNNLSSLFWTLTRARKREKEERWLETTTFKEWVGGRPGLKAVHLLKLTHNPVVMKH